MILGVIKSNNVQLHKIAKGMRDLGETTKLESVVHRLEDFFREVELNYEQLLSFLLVFLPKGEKIRLCIDRTNWEFGEVKINVLMVVGYTSTMHIPLYFEMLENEGGNSHTTDRIEIIENLIKLIGIKNIGLLIGDREFIGHAWLKFLKDNHIKFCVRVPKHHKITRINGFEEQEEGQFEDFIAQKMKTQKTFHLQGCMVDNIWVNVMIQKKDDGDNLILIGNIESQFLAETYKRRWKIETVFQSFKQRGFNLEDTHMTCVKKLKILIALVSIAFAICIKVGIYYHDNIKPIKMKNHGYKANSFCRKGNDFLIDIFVELPKFHLFWEKFNTIFNQNQT